MNKNENYSIEIISCHWVHTIQYWIAVGALRPGSWKKIPSQFHVNAILCELQFFDKFLGVNRNVYIGRASHTLLHIGAVHRICRPVRWGVSGGLGWGVAPKTIY